MEPAQQIQADPLLWSGGKDSSSPSSVWRSNQTSQSSLEVSGRGGISGSGGGAGGGNENSKDVSNSKRCPYCLSGTCLGLNCQYPSLEEAVRHPRLTLRKLRSQNPKSDESSEEASSSSVGTAEEESATLPRSLPTKIPSTTTTKSSQQSQRSLVSTEEFEGYIYNSVQFEFASGSPEKTDKSRKTG